MPHMCFYFLINRINDKVKKILSMMTDNNYQMSAKLRRLLRNLSKLAFLRGYVKPVP